MRGKFSTGQDLDETSFTDLIDSLTHPDDVVTSVSTEPSESSLPLSASVGYAISQDVATLESDVFALKTWKDNSPYPTTEEVATSIGETYNPLDLRITSLESGINAKASTAELGVVDARLTTVKSALDSQILANITQYTNNNNARLSDIANINALINGINTSLSLKASSGHTHSDYVETSTLDTYAKLTDLAAKASAIHTHSANQITGLDAIYTTPVQVQTLIDANKVYLDQTTILDDFYDKAEVDFAVAQATSGLLGQAQAYADTVKSDLLGGAPIAALDTIKELGDALSNQQDPVVDLLTLVNAQSSRTDGVDATIATIQASITALEGQVGTGVIATIQSELAQLSAAVDVSIDQKVADLQEQVNACMALITMLAGTSTSNNFDDLASISGSESATLAISGTTQTIGSPASEPMSGGFIAVNKADTPLSTNTDLTTTFKGTDNANQYIAYNSTSNRWEWLWVDPNDNSNVLTVATQVDSDDAHAPDFWDTIDPNSSFTGMPATIDLTASQSSTSSVVNYLEALRFFTSGYVQQGLDYVGG